MVCRLAAPVASIIAEVWLFRLPSPLSPLISSPSPSLSSHCHHQICHHIAIVSIITSPSSSLHHIAIVGSIITSPSPSHRHHYPVVVTIPSSSSYPSSHHHHHLWHPNTIAIIIGHPSTSVFSTAPSPPSSRSFPVVSLQPPSPAPSPSFVLCLPRPEASCDP